MNSSSASANNSSFAFAHGSVDFLSKEIVYKDGKRCPLLPTEIALLKYLATRPGVPVTRDELLAKVWKADASRTVTRTVDVHISQLRRKLRDSARKSALILTVHQQGYMLAARSAKSKA